MFEVSKRAHLRATKNDNNFLGKLQCPKWNLGIRLQHKKQTRQCDIATVFHLCATFRECLCVLSNLVDYVGANRCLLSTVVIQRMCIYSSCLFTQLCSQDLLLCTIHLGKVCVWLRRFSLFSNIFCVKKHLSVQFVDAWVMMPWRCDFPGLARELSVDLTRLIRDTHATLRRQKRLVLFAYGLQTKRHEFLVEMNGVTCPCIHCFCRKCIQGRLGQVVTAVNCGWLRVFHKAVWRSCSFEGNAKNVRNQGFRPSIEQVRSYVCRIQRVFFHQNHDKTDCDVLPDLKCEQSHLSAFRNLVRSETMGNKATSIRAVWVKFVTEAEPNLRSLLSSRSDDDADKNILQLFCSLQAWSHTCILPFATQKKWKCSCRWITNCTHWRIVWTARQFVSVTPLIKQLTWLRFQVGCETCLSQLVIYQETRCISKSIVLNLLVKKSVWGFHLCHL